MSLPPPPPPPFLEQRLPNDPFAHVPSYAAVLIDLTGLRLELDPQESLHGGAEKLVKASKAIGSWDHTATIEVRFYMTMEQLQTHGDFWGEVSTRGNVEVSIIVEEGGFLRKVEDRLSRPSVACRGLAIYSGDRDQITSTVQKALHSSWSGKPIDLLHPTQPAKDSTQKVLEQLALKY